IKGLARFRANVFYSKGAVAAVFRQIPSLIPDFEALGLPPVLLEMVNVSSGLFLVTGPTGSGKSTTLASIIDKLNQGSPPTSLPWKILLSLFTSINCRWLINAKLVQIL